MLAPSATDAAGTAVPVSMHVAGDLIMLDVDDPPGAFALPIAVDPEIIDKSLGLGTQTSNWVFKTTNTSTWYEERATGWLAIVTREAHGWKNEEYALLNYSTQGVSRIYELEAELTGAFDSGLSIEESIHIVNSKKEVEAERIIGTGEKPGWYALTGLCTKGSCSSLSERGSSENSAQYGLWANGTGSCCRKGWKPSEMLQARVYIAQEQGPEVSVGTASTVDGKRNVLYGSGSWLGSNGASAFEVKWHDPGIGVGSYSIETSGGAWSESGSPSCGGDQCEPTVTGVYAYNSRMPNGEYSLVGHVSDLMGLNSELAGGVVLKVDSTPPHGIKIAGLGSGNEIGEGEYTLTAEATDGEGTTKSSGIKDIQVTVDGREIGKPGGACEPGPCTAKATWTLNGAEFGAGENKLTVTATDNAGNVASETYTLKVHHTTPVAVGPGTVNPGSGAFSMSATDVSVSVPGGALTVSRAYGSRHLTAGALGPLGPQWALSVGGQESITVAPNLNTATLTSSTGGQTTFTAPPGGGTYTAPEGDSNLALSEVTNEKGEKELLLKDAADGVTTRFTSSPAGGSLWKATKQEGPLPSQAVRYTYETVEGVSRPREALAPEPAGVSCGKEIKELKVGCRALGFEYASETTASGEKPSEWGSYKGRLKEVLYYAYNPATKEIKPIAVAEYRYDAQGRLRAEWNPQISPTLKTTYGYDTEGHLTSLNPPGQEPWLLHYGSDAGDSNPGRPPSVIRPAASTPTELKAAEESAPPAITTAAPTLSSKEPKVGVKISVSSNGTWSNSPLAYSYQWEECNQNGTECVAIPGAVNQSYYPVSSDQGHDWWPRSRRSTLTAPWRPRPRRLGSCSRARRARRRRNPRRWARARCGRLTTRCR